MPLDHDGNNQHVLTGVFILFYHFVHLFLQILCGAHRNCSLYTCVYSHSATVFRYVCFFSSFVLFCLQWPHSTIDDTATTTITRMTHYPRRYDNDNDDSVSMQSRWWRWWHHTHASTMNTMMTSAHSKCHEETMTMHGGTCRQAKTTTMHATATRQQQQHFRASTAKMTTLMQGTWPMPWRHDDVSVSSPTWWRWHPWQNDKDAHTESAKTHTMHDGTRWPSHNDTSMSPRQHGEGSNHAASIMQPPRPPRRPSMMWLPHLMTMTASVDGVTTTTDVTRSLFSLTYKHQ